MLQLHFLVLQPLQLRSEGPQVLLNGLRLLLQGGRLGGLQGLQLQQLHLLRLHLLRLRLQLRLLHLHAPNV